jgi:hypothetical protein
MGRFFELHDPREVVAEDDFPTALAFVSMRLVLEAAAGLVLPDPKKEETPNRLLGSYAENFSTTEDVILTSKKCLEMIREHPSYKKDANKGQYLSDPCGDIYRKGTEDSFWHGPFEADIDPIPLRLAKLEERYLRLIEASEKNPHANWYY